MKIKLVKWHNALLWFGLAAIVCWAISGISHPLMAWFGPQQAKMFPPTLMVKGNELTSIEGVIEKHGLTQAVIAKVLPTALGPMLQITEKGEEIETETSAPTRRYFSLESREEMKAYDEKQAKWLAAYYTGRDINLVTSIQSITEFSNEYPRVNRLLPVYRVEIGDRDNSLTAYVYTETNALAAISNPNKQRLQTFFQVLHTWNWLDFTGHARVLLLALLLLTLMAMAITGLMLVITLRGRKVEDGSRRWHRSLGYVLWLPLLAWPASGFYHLLQAEYVEPVSGIRLGKTLDLQNWLRKTTTEADWLENYNANVTSNPALNAVSLVTAKDKTYYRLSLAPNASAPVTRKARFDGQAMETGVKYIDSFTGLQAPHNDRDQARELLQQLLGAEMQHSNIELVTRFGPGYDFRNKRLPVWQIDIEDSDQTRVFVDPVTGILVDQSRSIDRYEVLSFSLLHKWNHLMPLIGRQWRDILIVATLITCLLMSALGIQMYLKRRARIRQRGDSSLNAI